MTYLLGRSGKGGVREGGSARDFAIYSFFEGRIGRVDLSGNRLKRLLKFLMIIHFKRCQTLIMHYPFIGMPLSGHSFLAKMSRQYFLRIVLPIIRKKKLIIDVSDLPCEQAIGLGLEVPKYYNTFEGELLRSASNILVASESFIQMIIDKHFVSPEVFVICNNGGPSAVTERGSVEFERDRSRLGFIYAGTLNRGRSIEKMVEVFSSNPGADLFLIGSEGGWLEDICHPANIHYMGSLKEADAHCVVSQCDVGIIPYDVNQEYYHAAFPTKLSFYLTAGIPVLSTPVREVVKVVSEYNCGFVQHIADWPNFIEGLNFDKIKAISKPVQSTREHFEWEKVLERSFNKINKLG